MFHLRALIVYFLCRACQADTINICDRSIGRIDIDDVHFHRIQSPNYVQTHSLGNQGFYENDLDCELKFVTGEQPMYLILHFENFWLEEGPDGCSDTLCVHGVKSCGQDLKTKTLVYHIPAHNSFTLRLETDAIGGSGGFNIGVWTEPALTSGDSSTLVNIPFHIPAAYASEYYDRCSANVEAGHSKRAAPLPSSDSGLDQIKVQATLPPSDSGQDKEPADTAEMEERLQGAEAVRRALAHISSGHLRDILLAICDDFIPNYCSEESKVEKVPAN